MPLFDLIALQSQLFGTNRRYNFYKIFIVNRSYDNASRNLNTDGLLNLCRHDLLLEDVHLELKSLSNFADAVDVVEPIAMYFPILIDNF